MRPFILVVDDDPAIAELVTDSLEGKGYRVTYCTDAAQALVQAQGMNVGLLILDIMMPAFGTGLDAYRNIRNHPYLKRNLPVIFLTGLKPDQAKNMVPLDDPHVRLLHKPTTLKTLQSTISELTGDSLFDPANKPQGGPS